MNTRQLRLKTFDQSDRNLIVGDARKCPLPSRALSAISDNSDYVVEIIRHGLSAKVYHLRIDGENYALKIKRKEPLVRNLDGQLSFLNEIERRRDFEGLRERPGLAERLDHLVPTIYADYRAGIILCPWINGRPIADLRRDVIRQLFKALLACDEGGLMEWDLAAGNLMVDDSQKLWLFDFGYMYPYDPLTEYNSDGRRSPQFHPVERFETRFFFGWILNNRLATGAALDHYQILKEEALRAYEVKLVWLQARAASTAIIDWVRSLIASYERILSGPAALQRGYLLESTRSHMLDVADDLHGKSCTEMTLRRITEIEKVVREQFEFLKTDAALSAAMVSSTRKAVLTEYSRKRAQVECYIAREI